MSYNIQFRDEARSEFLQAVTWYEQKSRGLGTQFIDEIDNCIELVANQPNLFPIITKGIRRITVKRFPYCIYYKETDRDIIVIAIFHSRKNPTRWKRR